MTAAGFSRSRLERMHRVLLGYVERQDMPGLVALVSHDDDVHVETLGKLAFDNPAPMARYDLSHRFNYEAHYRGCGNGSGRRLQIAAR
jgi:hypothetical protein